MKRLVLFAALAALAFSIAGCGDGTAESKRERQERYKRVMNNEFKQINDDWDSFWLMDRPSRLTYSRCRVGPISIHPGLKRLLPAHGLPPWAFFCLRRADPLGLGDGFMKTDVIVRKIDDFLVTETRLAS